MQRWAAAGAAGIGLIGAVVVFGLALPSTPDTAVDAGPTTAHPPAPGRRGASPSPTDGPSEHDDGARVPGAAGGAAPPEPPTGRATPAPPSAPGSWSRADRRADPGGGGARGGGGPVDPVAADASSDDDGGVGAGFDSPEAEAEADWLEERMNAFVEVVVPEMAESGLSRSCSSDGRSCTFEGPTTEDSFMRRWINAHASGDVDLQGITFSEVYFEDRDDGRYFSFTASAPVD